MSHDIGLAPVAEMADKKLRKSKTELKPHPLFKFKALKDKCNADVPVFTQTTFIDV